MRFYKEGTWQKVRDDHYYLVLEKRALLNHQQADKLGVPYLASEKHVQIQMSVSWDRTRRQLEEFLGYYNFTGGHHGEQFGLSHHPQTEYPLLKADFEKGVAMLREKVDKDR